MFSYGDMTSPPEWGEPTYDMEYLENQEEMQRAEDNFMEAIKALEKAEKELYLSVYWADYAEVHRN